MNNLAEVNIAAGMPDIFLSDKKKHGEMMRHKLQNVRMVIHKTSRSQELNLLKPVTCDSSNEDSEKEPEQSTSPILR